MRPALGWTAMCSPGWGNLVAIDWNDLPVGREFDGKFLKNVKSPPYALPSLGTGHYLSPGGGSEDFGLNTMKFSRSPL